MFNLFALLTGMTLGGSLLLTRRAGSVRALWLPWVSALGTVVIGTIALACLNAGFAALEGAEVSIFNFMEAGSLVPITGIWGYVGAAVLFVVLFLAFSGRSITLHQFDEYDALVYLLTGFYVISLSGMALTVLEGFIAIGVFILVMASVFHGRHQALLAAPVFLLAAISEMYIFGRLVTGDHGPWMLVLIGAAALPLLIKAATLFAPSMVGDGYANVHDAIDELVHFEPSGVPVMAMILAGVGWGIMFLSSVLEWHSIAPSILVSAALISTVAVDVWKEKKYN